MKKLTVYDVEAERIEMLAENLDVTEAQIVEALLEMMDNTGESIEDYL